MSSIINSNINSLTAQTNLSRSQGSLSTSIARLSSGLRINSSADDAAGYAIAQGFTAQINGTNQAIRNASDGISLAQTAGGALNQVTSDLQRIRQLAVQSSNATNSSANRQALNQEVSQLQGDIGTIGNTTQFNGLNLLDGSYKNQSFQVGANVGNSINVSIGDSRAQSLGANVSSSTTGIASTTALSTAGLTVGGVAVATSGLANGDVSGLVDRINQVSATSGVTASVSTTNVNSLTYTAATGSVSINGVGVNLLAGDTIAQATAKFNAVSAQTGATAVVNGTKIDFTTTNGADLNVAESGTIVGGTATYKAGVTLSTNLTSATPTAAGGASAALALGASTQVSLAGSDVLTAANAQSTIKAVDYALSQIAQTDAQLGAIQNRFTATVANLQTTSTNLSSSRSAIQDTDFAAETANLSRTQVLQQAGTAVLAQANQIPNQVLALLR